MAAPVHPDQLRLLAKVARMYHERGMRQPQIARDLHISQSRVSRLLSQAVDLGIVRTTVTLPGGVHTDLEDGLQTRFGLLDTVVVDADGALGDVIPALGSAAGAYLTDTLLGDERVGISSWSATLMATVESMRPKNKAVATLVTQLFGGVGEPQVQLAATRLLDRFATVTGARPMFLPTQGVVADPVMREALLADASVTTVRRAWKSLTVTVVGIGTVRPSPMLARSGNAIRPDQQEALKELGAVGDVCLRFFDRDGALVESAFNQHVVGISPELLKAVPRRVGVAGGADKIEAIRAALLGGWVNTLVTDVDTARALLASWK